MGATRLNDGQCAWVKAHEALSRLARERAAADAEEGRWLLAAFRSAAHVHLGYGSFGEYIERLFGYQRRTTQEKLRVAEALEKLPLTARALAEGSLSWSAARELTRVSIAQTEGEWLEIACDKTVHQIEALVTGKAVGDVPSASGDRSARRHVLRFEVAAETLALVREAMNELRRRTPGAVDDDAALLLMARQVLGCSSDDGRSNYQIALSVCPECSKGSQQAGGDLVTVGAELVAMAQCDAQDVGLLGAFVAGDSAHTGDTSDHAEATNAHVGAGSEPRATQTIPPRVRRAVLRRDHGRCVVPGCRNGLYIDVHHVEFRSEGGSNTPDNLICLCGAHHRAVHRGELHVVGRVSAGVRFEHADGSVYGRTPKPRVVDAQAKAFAALRGLGFREREIRGVLAKLRQSDVDRVSAEPGVERVVRAALAVLTAPSQSH
jgi:5-methylcytosine-specific restriction endonuclease McrA